LIPQLAPAELAAWRADGARAAPVVVDVREPWEVAHCRIDGSISIPLAQLPTHLAELPIDAPLVIVCHHGSRSQHAAMFLAQRGYANVHNLSGGIEAWAIDVEPGMRRY
jgi:rhodanese-related sulfurtransferase